MIVFACLQTFLFGVLFFNIMNACFPELKYFFFKLIKFDIVQRYLCLIIQNLFFQDDIKLHALKELKKYKRLSKLLLLTGAYASGLK